MIRGKSSAPSFFLLRKGCLPVYSFQHRRQEEDGRTEDQDGGGGFIAAEQSLLQHEHTP